MARGQVHQYGSTTHYQRRIILGRQSRLVYQNERHCKWFVVGSLSILIPERIAVGSARTCVFGVRSWMPSTRCKSLARSSFLLTSIIYVCHACDGPNNFNSECLPFFTGRFKDFMINDKKSRFTEETLSLNNLGIFVPKILISKIHEDTIQIFESIWNQFLNVQRLSDRFANREAFIRKLQGEMIWWKEYWNKEKNDVPDTALNSLEHCDKDMFPTIYSLLKILASFTVSIASAERSFSPLKKIKTWLRCKKNFLNWRFYIVIEINILT
ncbi:uncharacterized protein LOC112693289 [Sipha flava]|uniref:Uncharacterized protein LOC112693289 n=1 Tax=Sipha flava TaxID=143950 RepID=A0A8B8GLE0_9HEMI|nr:uncharacterized protein LOC112693289 [Sipha flava]